MDAEMFSIRLAISKATSTESRRLHGLPPGGQKSTWHIHSLGTRAFHCCVKKSQEPPSCQTWKGIYTSGTTPLMSNGSYKAKHKMKQPRRSTQSKSEHKRHMMPYAKKNSKAYLTEWTKAFTQGSARGCYFLSTNIDESRRTRKREHRCHRSVTPWDLVPCLYRQVQKFSQMNWAVEMDRRSQGPSQSKIGTTSKVVDTHI